MKYYSHATQRLRVQSSSPKFAMLNLFNQLLHFRRHFVLEHVVRCAMHMTSRHDRTPEINVYMT